MTVREFVRLSGLDATEPLRVLVVEDKLSFAVRLVEFVREAGHLVTGVQGVQAIEGDLAEGIDLSGQPVRFGLRDFDLAFMDYYFLSRAYDGRSLTAELVAHGCPRIVGMSSEPAANARMLAAGAALAFRKAEIESIL